MTIFLNFWVLPVLFILHDFEEVICVPLWKIRHRSMLDKMDKPFFGRVMNGQAFAIGVLEEMLILVIASIICSISHNYTLYLAFLVVYTLHFAMHYKMCFSIKNYVPGVVTATLQLPFMIWLIISYWILSETSIMRFLMYFIPVFFIVFVNLFIVHKMMPVIQKKLLAYAR
ncbi:hypothetical protein FC19_GL000549 [Liquorilactobacillus aquaticus DSM 21051]|uniref:HXXEE domain-containing protein n=1 Tax=Liquorilactobacillus aquaticus DSM 21051 TaxID=1423725 RepID=A0A0R2CWP2_9LACO|nr:HXXEE domain-containing protein [Liquorilactobacillus aquaticus]KRM96269.1 hypothetical protein FC19_GL000549 [Liquorilactobacillus aquaticus DSM 21051]